MTKKGMTPWEFEINQQNPEGTRVLGTRQLLVRYSNAILKGKLDYVQLAKMPEEKWEIIKKWIPTAMIEKSQPPQ